MYGIETMNTLSSQQIVFLVGLGLALIIGLPLGYYSLVKAYGEKLAKRLMPNEILTWALIVLVFCLIFITVSMNIEAYLFIVFLGLAVFWWWRVIVLIFKRRQEPIILLDLGPVSHVSSNLIHFFLVAGIGFILLALFAKHVYYVFWGLMVLAQAAWYYLRNGEHALITDHSLQVSSNAIRWTRIKSFEWANEIKGKALLVVKLRKRFNLFGTQVLQIPAAYKDDTNRLLAEHVVRSPTV